MIPGLVAASTAVGNALWARAARQAFVREVCRAFNVGDPDELQVCVMRWLGVCGGWEGLKGGREAATSTQSDPGTRQLSRFSSPACARLANCCRPPPALSSRWQLHTYCAHARCTPLPPPLHHPKHQDLLAALVLCECVYKKVDMPPQQLVDTVGAFLADFPPGLVSVEAVQLSHNGVEQR